MQQLRHLVSALSLSLIVGACAVEDASDAGPAWRVSAVHPTADGHQFEVTIDGDPVVVTVVEQDTLTLAVLQDEEGSPLVSVYADVEGVQLISPETAEPMNVDLDRSDPYIAVTLAAAEGELHAVSPRISAGTYFPGGAGAADGTVEDSLDTLSKILCESHCMSLYLACRLHNCEAGPDDVLNPFCAYDYRQCMSAC